MKRRNLAALTAAATAVAVIPAAGALAASAGNDGRTVLPNSGVVHAKGLSMKGAAVGSQRMHFAFQLPMRNQDLANQLVQRGVVLSPAQYRTYFAPSKAQMKKVSHWAKAQGFTVTQTSRSSGQVMVSGTVSHVNKAFKVKMHRATLDGAAGLTVDQAPSVPASLGLSGVAGLNSVHQMQPFNSMQPNSRRTAPQPATAGSSHRMSTGGQKMGLPSRRAASPSAAKTQDCSPYWGDNLYPTAKAFGQESNYICGYLPADLSKMYAASSANSASPAIGILLWGNDPNMKAETNTYMKQVGYPALNGYHPTVAKPNDQMADCGPKGVQSEQALDVQSSHAISPKSSIYYYGAASCYDNDLTAMLQKAVDAHKVSTISMSFGTPSDRGMTKADMNAWDRPLKQAALTGISVFASSGDDGDNSFDTQDGKQHVGYPASSAYLTAVGGTSVGMESTGSKPVQAGWEMRFYQQPNLSKPAKTDVTDQIANSVDPQGNKYGYHGAGGGVSTVSTRPYWQNGVVSYSGSKRAVPDIAAVADPYTGYTILDYTGKYGTIGGTSLASPVVAATSALAKAKSKVAIGNMAPKFYALAKTSAIKDVNAPNKAGVYYPAKSYNLLGFDAKPQSLQSKSGWDNVTGVGVPGGKAFYTAFKK